MDTHHSRFANTALLVSVANEDELAIAIDAGVSVVDLKDPIAGPLAACDPPRWQAAVRMLQSRRRDSNLSMPPLSAALGEMDVAADNARQLPGEFRFAKAGPSTCSTVAELCRGWDRIRDHLPNSTRLVAVAYADGAIGPEDVLDAAIDCRLDRYLIDTFEKNGRTSLDHLGADRIKDLAGRAREAGVWIALAGSIDTKVVAAVKSSGVEPDCYAVRGAVCEGGRTGSLDGGRIRAFARTMNLKNRPSELKTLADES